MARFLLSQIRGIVRRAFLVLGWGGILGPRKDKPLQVFEAQPKTIRLVVMLSARFPRSLRNAVDLLRERGVEVSH